MATSRMVYRSRQVLHALRPHIEPSDLGFARDLLGDGEWRLFQSMEKRDQRHALAVARRLRAGSDDRDLLTAALLHDCGKGSVPVWLRILYVLSPRLVALLSKNGAGGVRGSAYRLANHASLGADIAAGAGSSVAVAALISGRALPQDIWKQALLTVADDES